MKLISQRHSQITKNKNIQTNYPGSREVTRKFGD